MNSGFSSEVELTLFISCRIYTMFLSVLCSQWESLISFLRVYNLYLQGNTADELVMRGVSTVNICFTEIRTYQGEIIHLYIDFLNIIMKNEIQQNKKQMSLTMQIARDCSSC